MARPSCSWRRSSSPHSRRAGSRASSRDAARGRRWHRPPRLRLATGATADLGASEQRVYQLLRAGRRSVSCRDPGPLLVGRSSVLAYTASPRPAGRPTLSGASAGRLAAPRAGCTVIPRERNCPPHLAQSQHPPIANRMLGRQTSCLLRGQDRRAQADGGGRVVERIPSAGARLRSWALRNGRS